MNAAKEEIKRWDFHRAFPCRWKGPALDANDNMYAMELFEIAYE